MTEELLKELEANEEYILFGKLDPNVACLIAEVRSLRNDNQVLHSLISSIKEIIYLSGIEDIYNWGAPLREITRAIDAVLGEK